ncbi:MAG TPA: hypothetical protein PKJ41_07935 [Bryobacteraceae bacterium]|nr:hypothetical protein [Bryobacteraceae bacterium]HPT27538.1 hypothetical protein [Bryobacteraceae bacterium]
MPNNNNDERVLDAREQRTTPPWIVMGAACLGIAGLGFGFYSHNQTSRILESRESDRKGTLEMQAQVQTLRNRLMAQEERERQLTAALTAAEQATVERAAAKPDKAPAAGQRAAVPARPNKQSTSVRRVADDPRLSQLEKRISEHDERLASTQRLVDTARTDLESRIDSTSRDLNGSIARTAEEVAALRRRGERDYFEFEILKSKQLQRVGPVSVALRKADVKKKRYNLDMLVDDNKLEKKSVNLLEPVYIASPDWAQPLELVVNQVTKNRVAGYISVPKYKRSDLAQSSAERSRLAATETAQVKQ